MRVENAVNITDLGMIARRRLPKVIFDFMDGGAEDEVTLRGNRQGFERYRFRPRLLTGNAKRDLSIDLFGDKLALPFLIGPTGLNGIHWRGGDLALANAAAAAGCGFVLSTASTESIEEVGQSSRSPKWFQLYPWGDRAFGTRMMERAKSSGYKALVVTVDSLTGGRRERDARNNFAHEVRLSPSIIWDGLLHPRWLTSVWLRGGGMPRVSNVAEFCPPGATAHDLAEFTRSMRNPGLTWNDMAWMKKEWGGPFLIKGVLTGEDVRRAIEIGADGIVVSNHGGRQLDNCIATIDALPEIVEVAGDTAVVLIDGGVRRGSDVVKALALGAKGVLLGRATLYGLAAGGQPGVAKALSILREEVDRVFALLGCRTVGEVTKGHVVRL
ncbi:MAG: (S)-mandelate dehydrogenase [Alphaproteobacteria bacterium]|nr:(S)-mandelate dehydrogenase [Alphaproteobacteria bacterium]